MENENYLHEDILSENSINWKELFPKVLSNWWLFILSLCLCVGVTWFYLHYQAISLYQVNAQVLIEDDNKPAGDDSPLNLLFNGVSNKDNEVVILQTNSLLAHLIRDNKLNVIWYRNDKFRNSELFQIPFALELLNPIDSISGIHFKMEMINQQRFHINYVYGGQEIAKEINFGKIFQLPGIGSLKIENSHKFKTNANEYDVQILGLRQAIGRLKDALKVNASDKLTSVIDLSLTTAIPNKGEYILTKYIQEYIDQNIQDKSRIADSTIGFIDARLILVNSELTEIESNIQEFLQARGLSNIEAQSQLMLENDNSNSLELATVEAQRELLRTLKSSIQSGDNAQLIPGNLIGDDANLNALITSYNDLTLQKEKLLVDYKLDNPFVENVSQQLHTVKSYILDYIAKKDENLRLRIEQLSHNSRKLKNNIHEVPAQARAFLALTRQQQLKQELYLFLLQKREETAVSKTNNIAGIRVIDEPMASTFPFTPKTKFIWIFACFLGLIIPFVKIFIENLLNTRVRNRIDIEGRTNIPVIGELSHNENKNGGELVRFNSSRSVLAERFRGLRTNLQFLMADEGDKIVMVTSGMPGEGKSFTSLNLANVIAASGLKVLLLEFDLRKPMLSKTYKNTLNKGITNYIVEKHLVLDDIINQVDGEEEGGVFFAACGPIPPNPSELILNPRTKQLLEEARKVFDIVVVDAPPLGAVTDAQLLTKHCDIVLYMVRAGRTPHDLVKLPADMVQAGMLKRVYIVLNDVQLRRGGYYGGSYYGYSYGYYDEEPPSLLKRLRLRR